jgi:hypothetical protein
VVGTDPRLCLTVEFGTRGLEPTCSATRELVAGVCVN